MFRIFCIRRCLGTVSKALLMSIAVRKERWEGVWFRPFIMCCEMLVSAVEVEWSFLNPCWCGEVGIMGSIFESIIFSINLLRDDKREIGRYEDGRLGSFLGFNLGMMMAFFQRWGM